MKTLRLSEETYSRVKLCFSEESIVLCRNNTSLKKLHFYDSLKKLHFNDSLMKLCFSEENVIYLKKQHTSKKTAIL